MFMNQTKSEIRQLAQKIIDNKIDFVGGCRKIAQLSYYLNDVDFNNVEEHLLIMRGISSESDRFPLGEVRKTCSPKHLAKLDLDKEGFVAFYRPQVLHCCQDIVQL